MSSALLLVTLVLALLVWILLLGLILALLARAGAPGRHV